MSDEQRRYPAPRYEIRVRGHLGEVLLGGFPTMAAKQGPDYTVLSGALTDQAALHGVLSQIEALGLELLELRRVPGGSADRHDTDDP